VADQEKALPIPAAWKNSYFWIAAILLVVGIIGLPFLFKDEAIRDPGQADEPRLWLIYFAGALIMFVGGVLSHKQTVQAYQEALEAKGKE